MKKILWCVLIALTANLAFAEEEGEYDFSWLDPDKKIYVVQNRKYDKAKKFEITLSGGIGPGKSFRNVWTFIPRASYYFNESFGFSALGVIVSHDQDGVFEDLKSLTSVIPSVRDINNFVGASALWVPFYAKINVFNTILYIDWQVEAGAGLVNSEIDLNTSNNGTPILEEESFLGFYWGTGQKFFFSRTWAFRWDLLAIYYNAPIAKNGSTVGQDSELEDQYFVSFGISAHF